MSQGRAATIFVGVPGVRVVAENTREGWCATVASLEADPITRGALEQSAEWVRSHTDPAMLRSRLGTLLGI